METLIMHNLLQFTEYIAR